MQRLIRILNDDDLQTLAWLRKHVGDVRVAAAARQLGVNGKPYLSAMCRYLGVRTPTTFQHRLTVEDYTVGERHLAQIRELLSQRSKVQMKSPV